jgi:hypothetical protein
MLGSIRMKKIAFVLAAAGLMSLAACNKTEAPAVDNNAEMAMDNVEVPADNMDVAVDNSANATAVDTMTNATADNAVATNM